MSRIMIKCMATGQAVSTGMVTDQYAWKTLAAEDARLDQERCIPGVLHSPATLTDASNHGRADAMRARCAAMARSC